MVEIKCDCYSEPMVHSVDSYVFIQNLIEMYHIDLYNNNDVKRLNQLCSCLIAFHYISDIRLVLLKKYLEKREEVIIKKHTRKKISCMLSDDAVYEKVNNGVKNLFCNRFVSLSRNRLTPQDRERISFDFDVLTDLMNHGIFDNLPNFDCIKNIIENRNLISLSNKSDAIDAIQLKYVYSCMGIQEFLKRMIPFIYNDNLENNQYFDEYVLPHVMRKKI